MISIHVLRSLQSRVGNDGTTMISTGCKINNEDGCSESFLLELIWLDKFNPLF